MKLVEVLGVRVEMPGNQPIVLLKEVDGDRFLPIWIGTGEASAIAFAQQGMETSRPLTIDLLVDVIGGSNLELNQIEITKLIDGIFHAELVFKDQTRISARPSDAIALGLKMAVPIYSDDSVLEQAGVVVDEEPDSEAEVERFREFLEQINPEDFS